MAHLILQGRAERIPLPGESVGLVFGSPPYVDSRLYLEDGRDIGIARNLYEWVDWMLKVTAECLRVSRGPVVWVAAGKTEDRNYWPACEGLMWEWHKRGGHAYRPCYWHRNGISGSGGDQWFRADVEYVMCFKRPGPLEWSNSTAMGHPPKWAPGGAMSHRVSDGSRVNQWGGRETSGRGKTPNGGLQEPGRPSHVYVRHMKQPNGTVEVQGYVPPVLANPGNFHEWGFGSDESDWLGLAAIHTNAGGGNMGNPHAHLSEAPFPEDLAEFFIRSLCAPGDSCLDPFSGSGTTVSVAQRLGRIGIGMDLRRSQCELARRRIERPHARVPRPARAGAPTPLLDGLDDEA